MSKFTQDKVADIITDSNGSRISRREAMRRGLAGAAGLLMADGVVSPCFR